MTKHSERIWRTVVFAGAMLGAPLVSADTPPPAKPAANKQAAKPKPPADTVESLTKELAAVDKQIELTGEALKAAQTDADRKAATAKLEQHKKTKAELETKLADAKRKAAPATPLAKLEQELAALQPRLDAAADAVDKAKSSAERDAASARLAALRKDKVELDRKIAAEKQKATRPRTPPSDRPVGRGFVLS